MYRIKENEVESFSTTSTKISVHDVKARYVKSSVYLIWKFLNFKYKGSDI